MIAAAFIIVKTGIYPMTDTSTLAAQEDVGQALGRFLQDRRARLDPASFGFSSTRRRTPGLRREEALMQFYI